MPRPKKSPVRMACLHCSTEFSSTNSRTKYCRPTCRTAAWHNANQSTGAPQEETSFFRYDEKARRKEERQETQDWIYETVFSTPKEFRADVLMALLVFAATSYNSGIPGATRYRDILTYPSAQRSNRFTAKDNRTAHLHFRGQPMTYPLTVASMAHHVCKFHLGMSSSEFIAEIRRDGVTMADMQTVFDELMDTTKPEPVIQGCDIEAPAWDAPVEDLMASQIAHARAVLSDPLGAAWQANEIGRHRITAAGAQDNQRAETLASDMLRIDQEVQAAQQRIDALLATEAGALAAANARFMQLIAAE
jgi:hypothetical protein